MTHKAPETVIANNLRDGLGVEDIAVKHRISLERVRKVVCEMRDRGELREIYSETWSLNGYPPLARLDAHASPMAANQSDTLSPGSREGQGRGRLRENENMEGREK